MSSTSNINYFQNLTESVRFSIAEDLGSGDITAQLVPENQTTTAKVITRESAIVCGRPWFDEVFKQIDSTISIKWMVNEGEEVAENQTLAKISGKARSILTAERCALNFLQTLMGTATTSRRYSQLANGSAIKILDTRKTIPGLRLAQKYAVKIGGCNNHRIGLYDAFLIKENHINACGSIAKAVAAARKLDPEKLVEIETESIDELSQAIDANADIIMLDNFSDAMLEQALKLKTNTVKYELSGNLEAKAVEKHKKQQIDFLSSGALTKHCKAIDLSMRFES